MFFSNKDERDLIGEIIIIILFLVIIIPVCVSASNNYNNRESYLNNVHDVYASLSENPNRDYDNKIVSDKIVTIGNENDSKMKISLVFKIYKYSNSYTLKLDDKTYDLDKIEYIQDGDYLYYNLGLFEIDNETNMSFKLIMNNDISYDDSVSYSFLIEGI